MINRLFFCSELKICDLDQLFSFDLYLLNFSSNFIKMVYNNQKLKICSSNRERMISVD